MSIEQHPITTLEADIIEWARKSDTLSDHCDLVDYYTDTGSVPEHWRVKWQIMGVIWAFAQAKPERAAQQERQPLTSAEIADLWDGTLFHINDLSTATDFVRDVEALHGIASAPQPKEAP